MVMPSIIGGSLAAAGGIIGGHSSAKQAAKNNEAMLDYQKNRYQYTVKDLRAAGLNPIMAVKGMSPGNAPSLQQSNVNPLASGLSAAGNMVMQGYSAKTQRNSQEQQQELMRVQEVNSAADTLNKVKQAEQIEAQTRYINEQTITQGAQRALMLKQGNNYDATTGLARANTGLSTANTARTQYDNVEARKKAEFYNTNQGQGAVEDAITNKTGGVVGAVDTGINWLGHAISSLRGNPTPHSAKALTPKPKPNAYQQGLINNYKR